MSTWRLVMDKKTDITAKGPVGIEPLSADLALEVKSLDIRPFQPYFTEFVQLDVTRGFVVSLLTDRNGKINLDIPLTGSLDDPQFKIWPIIWQILENLITKAVTAPFSLLSSLTAAERK